MRLRRQQSELESVSTSVPDIPKKTRPKKSKESDGGGSSSRSKDTGGSLRPRKDEVFQISSLKNHTIPEGGEVGSGSISWSASHMLFYFVLFQIFY